MTAEISELTTSQLCEFYKWPQERSFRLNVVLSPTGNITGEDGTSSTLTTSQDRRLLRTIRDNADVVILGAESVRQEGWFLPPHGRLFVLSRSGRVSWENCPDPTRVILLPTVSAIIHHLVPEDVHILCEGGMKTAEVIAKNVGFDEIALSFAGHQTLGTPPASLTQNMNYDLKVELKDTEHKMTFGLWRRAI